MLIEKKYVHFFLQNCLNRLKLFAFQSNKWSKDRKNKLEGRTLAMSFIAQTYLRDYRDTLLNVFYGTCLLSISPNVFAKRKYVGS